MLRKSFDGEVYYWWDDGKPYPRARKARTTNENEKQPEHNDTAAAKPKDSEGEDDGPQH